MKSLTKCLILLSFFFEGSYADSIIPVYSSNIQVIHPTVGSDQKVPLINIAPPNSDGVSHNQFNEFNISNVVFNNHNGYFGINTELAGRVSANPNLSDQAANLIIVELTDPEMRPSELGKIEVAGHKPMVVIASPWGISCNGCGFINANRGMLMTGIPQFDQNKKLLNYYVSFSGGGKIVIQKNGLISPGAEYLTLMTRSLEVQGDVIGKDIAVILGTNMLDTKGKVITVNKPYPPSFALEVGDLGGMYAGKISLVSTELGIGLKYNGELNKLNAKMSLDSQGNLGPNVSLAVNGDFSFNGLAKTQEFIVKSINSTQPTNFDNSGVIEVADSFNVMTNGFKNDRTIQAGHAYLQTENLTNSGIIYLKEDSSIAVNQALDIENGKIIGKKKIELHIPQALEQIKNSITAEKLVHELIIPKDDPTPSEPVIQEPATQTPPAA